ncbi:MAG: hypothetical protein JSV22_08055 [Bacteroidales bacterium]|nr:MAG: hypothetical protein JSV22_08055 [Bacteroidales bacterium]
MQINRKLGWLRDYADIRDFSPEHSMIKPMLTKIRKSPVKSIPGMPGKIDLRGLCSPVEDQEDIGSCTANAGVALIEYFENKAYHKFLDASRLFLYKVTRNYLQLQGDTGAYLRSTIAAMALFGVPPEKYWPYDTSLFDEEPPTFCYSFAQNFKAIKYFRLDSHEHSPNEVLMRIKKFLATGFPSMFGFTVFDSVEQSNNNDGQIPFPNPETDRAVGGHAVAAVGYDDKKVIKNERQGKPKTTGAFLIRNSWGKDWGEDGYGWLPYDYVLKSNLASDWWTLIKQDYIDLQIFDQM